MTTSKPPTNMPASVRGRLEDVARQRRVELQLLLSDFAIERLLYRLGASVHAQLFILKGATLFKLWGGEQLRATWDLDLLGRGTRRVEGVVEVVRALCGVESDDGIIFEGSSVSGEEILYHRDINLGIAVALDWGLIVPVIKNADDLSLVGLARAANDLANRARTKKLLPDEVQGGTFTITNPGVYGSLFGTPIINQPQVAILNVGTIEKRAKVVELPDGTDTIAVRTMGYLALSFDHRLVDGAEADAFMGVVKSTIENGSFAELE